MARLGRAAVNLTAALVLSVVGAVGARGDTAEPRHGVSMHGDLKYGPDFTHFEYADPNAPKGGSVTYSANGTFDTLNPFILRGVAAAGAGGVFETLTAQSGDEPFSEYGNLAKAIVVPEDRSWVAFELRPEARWHDGRPVTADDVIWTFQTLKTKGHPFYRAYYKSVVKAEKDGERRVRFTFEGGVNRELPLIMGQLPVLPEHWWEGRDFEKPLLEAPLGSGPYRVRSFEIGRGVTYERVKDWWGVNVPVNKGRFNYDEIRYEYYRDADVALEAFKAGQYDLRIETSAKAWATGYESPALAAGLIKKEEIRDESGDGMQGFAYNTRREIFKDPRVRQALAYAFDFEWTNANLFYGAYTRTQSYFSNTELAARELPGPKELALLAPFEDQLPPEVLTRIYTAPASDGSGNIRENLRTAFELLKQAGWEIDTKTRALTNKATGTPMTFEILLNSPAFERISAPFAKNLERLGVTARIRTVDPAQYENRIDDFDFDMTVVVWGQSLSPGNEQRDYWSCEAAETKGSRNYVGICQPAIDALIQKIIEAPTREDLVAACRALDRVLLWNHYVVPHWHTRVTRVAYWDKLARPKVSARYGVDLFTWWVEPAKVGEVEAKRRRLGG